MTSNALSFILLSFFEIVLSLMKIPNRNMIDAFVSSNRYLIYFRDVLHMSSDYRF